MAYNVSVRFAKLLEVVGGVLVINTTFALAGNIPLAGRGSTTPPMVMVAFTLAINAGSLHNPFHALATVGHDTVRAEVFNGLCPTWKKTISWSYSVAEQASINVL